MCRKNNLESKYQPGERGRKERGRGASKMQPGGFPPLLRKKCQKGKVKKMKRHFPSYLFRHSAPNKKKSCRRKGKKKTKGETEALSPK